VLVLVLLVLLKVLVLALVLVLAVLLLLRLPLHVLRTLQLTVHPLPVPLAGFFTRGTPIASRHNQLMLLLSGGSTLSRFSPEGRRRCSCAGT